MILFLDVALFNLFESSIRVGILHGIIRFDKTFRDGLVAYFSLEWSWFTNIVILLNTRYSVCNPPPGSVRVSAPGVGQPSDPMDSSDSCPDWPR